MRIRFSLLFWLLFLIVLPELAVCEMRPGDCYQILDSNGRVLSYHSNIFKFSGDINGELSNQTDQNNALACFHRNGKMSIKSKSWKFLSASSDGSFNVVSWLSDWEYYTIDTDSSGSLKLKSHHGKTLGADSASGQLIQEDHPFSPEQTVYLIKRLQDNHCYSILSSDGANLSDMAYDPNGAFFSFSHLPKKSAFCVHFDGSLNRILLKVRNTEQLNTEGFKEGYLAQMGDTLRTADQPISEARFKPIYNRDGTVSLQTFRGNSLSLPGKTAGTAFTFEPIPLEVDPQWVTNSTIGYWQWFGRFGNQIYQYLFLKVYAKRHHLKVQTRNWVGDQIFGLEDPKISMELPMVTDLKKWPEYSADLYRSYLQEADAPLFSGHDIQGYFQINTSAHAQDRDYIRSLFQPTPYLKSGLDHYIEQIRARGRTIIAAHVRRGDVASNPNVAPPSDWYLEWLKTHWDALDHPVLFLASDSIDAVLPAFAKYHPITVRDFKPAFPSGEVFPVSEADFYPDFYVLTQADVLLLSKSTFSTAAALLNTKSKDFWISDFTLKKLVSMDPWNTIPN